MKDEKKRRVKDEKKRRVKDKIQEIHVRWRRVVEQGNYHIIATKKKPKTENTS